MTVVKNNVDVYVPDILTIDKHTYMGIHILYPKLILIEERIENCKRCYKLNIPKKTMAIKGYGNIFGNMFAVGLSSHAYCDYTKERQIPFIGPNKEKIGNAFYKMLDKANFSYIKNNLFFTNVIKCHLPKGRSPFTHEVKQCRRYLTQEFMLWKTASNKLKIVLAIGGYAKQYFNIDKNLVPFKINDIWYIGIPHPSYISRYYTKSKAYHHYSKLQTILLNLKDKGE